MPLSKRSRWRGWTVRFAKQYGWNSLPRKAGPQEVALDHGADIDGQDIKTGLTPLHIAVSIGHVETVGMLLKAGARTDIPDAEGDTAKTFAIAGEDKQIRKMLGISEPSRIPTPVPPFAKQSKSKGMEMDY